MKTTHHRMIVGVSGAALIACVVTGCKRGVEGTYSDPGGGFVLDLKSGGKATMTMAGQQANCTYTTADKQISVSCEGEAQPLMITVHDDGTLTGPPTGMLPALKKK